MRGTNNEKDLACFDGEYFVYLLRLQQRAKMWQRLFGSSSTHSTKEILLRHMRPAKGEVTIVDEFAPHRWSGPHAAQNWAADYDKHAKATGVTDGQVKCGIPTRIEREGDLAYVILPTEYLYKEHGKAMDEKGSITAVIHREDGSWRMRAWTWSGEKPYGAK